MSTQVADVRVRTAKQVVGTVCSMFSQFPYIALIGFAAAVASAALAPNGVFLVTQLTASGSLPLPAELTEIGVTALDALTAITLGLASLCVFLSFLSREDLRKGCHINFFGPFLGFLWSVTLARLATFFVFCIHVIHLVLLVAYGAILAIIFLFNVILCPSLDELVDIFKSATSKANDAGASVEAPPNPLEALCDLASSGFESVVYLVAGEVLFGIATACMLMSLGGTIAYNVISKRGVRADKKAKALAKATAKV